MIIDKIHPTESTKVLLGFEMVFQGGEVMTNFELIKSMSKEQLAAWLTKNMTATAWMEEVCGAVCRSCENWTGDGCKYDLETYECKYVVDDYALFLRWLDLGWFNEP